MEYGADINKKNGHGYTPLIISCREKYIDIVKLLIENGADVNTEDEYGNTPLIYSCEENNLSIVKILIEHGADIHKKNNEGKTAMDMVKGIKNEELIDYMNKIMNPEPKPKRKTLNKGKKRRRLNKGKK